ncbi:MAG: hypothetical protein KDA95_04190 [Acidimicrobiales bacterium]|nr:hypothetical protein [Acidimicrobiales bacterium]
MKKSSGPKGPKGPNNSRGRDNSRNRKDPRDRQGATPLPDARKVAVEALVRVERDGAYANLILPKMLSRSGLGERDRAFATQLVYGTIRYQRGCDWFIERFAIGELEPEVKAALRVGTYQLRFLSTPPHAAVSATVDTVPRRARGLVNAVLRKISGAEDSWPSKAVELSYPDWIFETLTNDLGAQDALAALESMNSPASAVEREDGYIQDRASQFVVEAVDAAADHLVADLCSAPGGKATALAGLAAHVAACEIRPARAGLVAANVERLGLDGSKLSVLVADGLNPPYAAESFDRVLVDAPCSGLGSLRRRPDARWRIDEQAPQRLAKLQVALLDRAADLVAPGGWLIYSVCTLTKAETTGVAEEFERTHGQWSALEPLAEPWKPWGSGSILLPQEQGTDAMALFRWRRPDSQES